MTSDQPTPIPVPARSRRRPAHVWTFERLETRALLSTSPIVATARELASARPIGSGVATGSVAPGSRAFYRLDLLTDQRLVATLHAPGASARLTLLDGQGRELTRSEGRSATDRDARIAQHLGPGTAYFEVEGLTGAGPFRLTADREAASIPDQSIPLDPFADTGPLASGDFNGDGRLDLASGITVDDGFEFFGGISMLLGVGDRTFAPPVTYPLNSSNVAALAVGDFNKDGRLDLAAGVEAEDEFSSGLEIVVLLGAGDGTFGRPDVVFFAEIDYFTGVEFSLAVGDFDGDGRADLATGIGFAGFSGSGGGVVVLLGSGDGTFAPPDYYLLGNIVASLEAGDFDGDGRPDLVAGIGIYFPTPGLPFLSFGSFGAVSVLLGIGDGTFAPTVDYAVDFSVVSVAVGDFDGDGRPDLAAGNGTVGASNSRPGIVVLKGIGDGAFTSPESYLVGSLALDLAVGDFDGDGRADLAVGNQLGGGIAVLLGAGNGSFGPPATSLTGSRISGYSIRDYDGDGRPDLAANIGTNDRTGTFGEVKVLRGAGDGTFGPPAISPADVFNSISSMVASDFSGDGRLDLVVGDEAEDHIAILLGGGDGTFGLPDSLFVGSSVISLVAGDFNGDGRPDIAVGRVFEQPSFFSTGFPGGIVILLGAGNGTFATTKSYATDSTIFSLTVGDFDGDGRPDLAAGTEEGVLVLRGAGDGTFSTSSSYAFGGFVPSVAVGDFDGDGRPDLAASTLNLGIALLLGAGGGTLRRPSYYLAGSYFSSLAAGDFDSDGRTDLAAGINPDFGSGDDNGVVLLRGASDGTFGPPKFYLKSDLMDVTINSLAVGDFDGDGRPDLAVGKGFNEGVDVLRGLGDGSFAAPEPYLVGFTGSSLVVGDFNEDGRPDLGAPESALLNVGDGRFVDPGSLTVGIKTNPHVLDTNGDLIVLDRSGAILLRRSIPGQPGRFLPPIVVNPGTPALDITILTNGGRTLIAAADAGSDSVSLYDPSSRTSTRIGGLSTGRLPAQVVSGHLDADGISDLVVRDARDGTVSIFLGLPGGGFRPMPALSIGLGASDIALADLDGSGRPSLVVTNQVVGDVRVYPGRGDGTFGPPSRHQAGPGPYGQELGPDGTRDLVSVEATVGLAVVPLVRGGLPVLVTLNPGSNTFAVLQGLGRGTFADARVVRHGDGARLPYGINSARVVRSSDFDGDGRSDLALLGTDGVTLYLGDGRGNFQIGSLIDAGPSATGLTVADVDLDGVPDLLVGNTYGDVLILLGNGDGTFAPFRKTDQAIALVAADLDGDGRPEFIYANRGLDRVAVTYSFGPRPVVVGDQAQGLLSPGAVTLADLNGDDIPDLVVANSGSNNVLVYLGLGGGRFGRAANGGNGFFTGTNPVGLKVFDVNDDDIPDLMVANQGSNDVSVLFGRGSGAGWTLDPGPRLKVGAGPASMVVDDINEDGNPDLLVSEGQSNQVRLLPGVGQGFFDDQDPTLFPVGTNPGPLFVGDFAGPQGGLDLVTVNAGSNDLTLVRDFLGGFVPQGISIPSQGLTPTAALSGDFTGDGFSDLLVANSGDGTLALFLGGSDDLDLFDTMHSSEAPSPTSLALDALSGDVLQFYAGTAGKEAAIRLAFNLADLGGGAGGGGGGPVVPPPPSTDNVRQVARLQPLGNGTSLALVASLLSLTVQESTSEESVERTASDAAGRLPNQPTSAEDEEVNVDEEADEDEEPAPPDLSPEALSPLLRILHGLDEAFERARRDASDARRLPGAAERSVRALDHLLDHWSPVLVAVGGPMPALASRLTRMAGVAARVVDRAWEAIPDRDPASIGLKTSATEVRRTPAGRLPIPPMVAAVSLGMLGAARASRRWTSTRSTSAPSTDSACTSSSSGARRRSSSSPRRPG